jgi:hypothetical protein
MHLDATLAARSRMQLTGHISPIGFRNPSYQVPIITNSKIRTTLCRSMRANYSACCLTGVALWSVLGA